MNSLLGPSYKLEKTLKKILTSGGVLVKRYASIHNGEPKQTCLYNFHRERIAKMEPFANYLMPIVYKNQSIKMEHMQTRNAASAFDVSHMMQTIVRGKDMVEFMESITVADIEGMGLNRCSLTVFTNETGGIIDDCIVGKCKNHLQIVSNANNAELVWNWMNKQREQKSGLDVTLERMHGQGLIALQGPKAASVLQQLTEVRLDDLKFMSTTHADLRPVGTCVVTRCGYTGEDGFEISVKSDAAEALMQILCDNELVLPAGLGARDTLRLEAGLCLHGHDINSDTTPIEAALNWVVHKRRRVDGRFPGATKILDQLKNGSKIKRVGLVAKSVGGPPAREGSEVLGANKTQLGRVTSGNYSPVLNRNIAMAYLPTEVLKKQEKGVYCTVRGKELEYQITKMPFVKTNYYI